MVTAWLVAATMRRGGRYTGRRWRYLARYIRRRDGWRCRNVHCRRTDAPLHVHHLTPVAQGGSYWPVNLVTLCAGCHERVHGWDLDRNGMVGA